MQVAVTSDDTGAATVLPATLDFPTTDWDTPQTVTVQGVDDSDSSDESVTISLSATSDDTDYEGETATVAVAISDGNATSTGAPTISGTAQVGNTLTADTSGITDSDGLTNVSYAYQWIRVDADGTSNPTNISGAGSRTYTLAPADVGKRVKVRVSFTDDAGFSEQLTSQAFPSGTITPVPNTPATGKPTISGTATVNRTLSASTAGITDANGLSNVGYSYQWIRVDGAAETNIPGETSTT